MEVVSKWKVELEFVVAVAILLNEFLFYFC